MMTADNKPADDTPMPKMQRLARAYVREDRRKAGLPHGPEDLPADEVETKRRKLIALDKFLGEAAVPGSEAEAALEKIFADGAAKGIPVFNRIVAPTMVIIDPLMGHLAAEDTPAEPS